MKVELVDVCGPTDMINEEVERLEAQGFSITGQNGGGGYGSCLVLKKGETEEERKQVEKERKQQEAFARDYWEWHNKNHYDWW